MLKEALLLVAREAECIHLPLAFFITARRFD
jgi:hypothetical protein